MAQTDTDDRRDQLAARYRDVRALTESLAAPLSAEDQMVQSMPDVSPTKWHRGHTSWFFETFLLQPELTGYALCDPGYSYIFNSYYETVGARHPRAERGLISRPGAAEVALYRRHVDRAMASLLEGALDREALDLVELGLHHEQQHQELLLMDIKHVLSYNPLLPAYSPSAGRSGTRRDAAKAGWIEHQGGLVEIGHDGRGFAFDNESPRHSFHLAPFALADRPVTCGEWLAFVDDGGYSRPELWLSDGWALVQQQGWAAPLYWKVPVAGAGTGGDGPGVGHVFTLGGERPVDPAEPVCHVSYYEAHAFAHWCGARLPTEAEWEAVAAGQPVRGNLLDPAVLHPAAPAGASDRRDLQLFGDVWEWTSSAYSPYPGYRVAEGAVGEYNGKFMVNQYVLRGGSCATPRDHLRASYRNFFPAASRWAFSGVRLARDL
jgi:ergothioneine biosynthesis protein EgtB